MTYICHMHNIVKIQIEHSSKVKQKCVTGLSLEVMSFCVHDRAHSHACFYSLRPSVLFWGCHSTWLLQWLHVTDRLGLSLSEMDWVPWLHAAVPRQGAWRSQLLQEPWPWVPALVLLQTAVWSHRLGLLQLPPGWGSWSECCIKCVWIFQEGTCFKNNVETILLLITRWILAL